MSFIIIIVWNEYAQARSQKFAMGKLVWGPGGGAPSRWKPKGAGGLGAKPPAARGAGVWGAESPTLENFAFFCKNNLILEQF